LFPNGSTKSDRNSFVIWNAPSLAPVFSLRPKVGSTLLKLLRRQTEKILERKRRRPEISGIDALATFRHIRR